MVSQQQQQKKSGFSSSSSFLPLNNGSVFVAFVDKVDDEKLICSEKWTEKNDSLQVRAVFLFR